jgi:hypothetical protein
MLIKFFYDIIIYTWVLFSKHIAYLLTGILQIFNK